jgi:hypothetical protein
VLKGCAVRNTRKRQANISLAWHIAAFRTRKRLPPLNSILDKIAKESDFESDAERQQTPEEMLEMLAQIDGGDGLMKFEFVPHDQEGATE